MHLSRRHLLGLGGAALAGASVAPVVACAQTPKRGGTLAIRTWDHPTSTRSRRSPTRRTSPLSFTHSRLLKRKAGPSVVPSTFRSKRDCKRPWDNGLDDSWGAEYRGTTVTRPVSRTVVGPRTSRRCWMEMTPPDLTGAPRGAC